MNIKSCFIDCVTNSLDDPTHGESELNEIYSLCKDKIQVIKDAILLEQGNTSSKSKGGTLSKRTYADPSEGFINEGDAEGIAVDLDEEDSYH